MTPLTSMASRPSSTTHLLLLPMMLMVVGAASKNSAIIGKSRIATKMQGIMHSKNSSLFGGRLQEFTRVNCRHALRHSSECSIDFNYNPSPKLRIGKRRQYHSAFCTPLASDVSFNSRHLSRLTSPQRLHHLHHLQNRKCSHSFMSKSSSNNNSNHPQNQSLSSNHSQSFYQSLSSPNNQNQPPKHILAPMVAQSDLPFRLMCEHLHNVDLSYTQMIHSANFVEECGEVFRRNHLDVYAAGVLEDALYGCGGIRDWIANNGVGKDGDFVSSGIIVSPSQLYALEGLSEEDIESSRERILAGLCDSKESSRSGDGASELEKNRIAKPTVVQIAGPDPDVALEAAFMILERSGTMKALNTNGGNGSDFLPVAAIDLNLGCPQGIARKGNYGSFLHDDNPQSAYKVLTKLRSHLPPQIGVTAKIRLPPTQADADAGKLGSFGSSNSACPPSVEERIHRLIDCGVDLITVHGRTRFENKVTVGAAHWDAIKRSVIAAREYSGDANYPVFANGGIESFQDVMQCLEETGASGVMSSEGLLENPGLFRRDVLVGGGRIVNEVNGAERLVISSGRDLLHRQLEYADTYLDYATLFPPLPGSLGNRGGSFNVIRSHLFKFLHRYLEENPDLRTYLGNNQEFQTIKQGRDLINEIRLRYGSLEEDQLRSMKSWDFDSSWYRRHRQPELQKRKESSLGGSSEDISSLSVEEKKKLAKLRIKKLREERMKRDTEARIAA